MERSESIKRLVRSAFGLAIFSLGVSLALKANIGVAPWEALSLGVAKQLHLTYGLVHSFIATIILIIDLLLKEKIGFGTLFDAFLVGSMVDFFIKVNPLPIQNNIIMGILLMVLSMTISALGQAIYISAGQGCGPRDTFLIAIGKIFSQVPIGIVNTVLMIVIFVISIFLDAPLGIGTIMASFGSGAVMQIVFNILHFEPRNVVHQNLIQTTRKLF